MIQATGDVLESKEQFSLFTNNGEHESPKKSNWFDIALETLEIDESEIPWPDQFGKNIRHVISSYDNDENKIKVLSLFSGGGGLDIGFHDAGFDIIECNELVPEFAKTLEINAANGGYLEGAKIVCEDIRNYTPKFTSIDFIIGGPPCQTFSAAGARAAGVNGTDDERGNLFLQYARLINRLQPKGFLFENVYRIVGAQGGKAWAQIQAAFRELGYTLHWRILDSSDYGVPQFRERLIIVGTKGIDFNFPKPSHGPDSANNKSLHTAIDAIAGLMNTEKYIEIKGRHGHLLNAIPPGLNYSFYTERMKHPTPIFAWRSKFSDYLYKADPNTPVRTIKAQGGQYTGPFSWENRPFTVAELKRLQTFPDCYPINGSRQVAIHQIGNSVPPQFARILALCVRSQIFQKKVPFGIDTLFKNEQLSFRQRKSELTSIYASKAEHAISSAKPKRMAKINSSEISYWKVNSDFSLSSNSNPSNGFKEVKTIATSTSMHIEIIDLQRGENYDLEIFHQSKNSSIDEKKSKKIQLSSPTCDLDSMFLMWKVLEAKIREYWHKDDLVQYFGYYKNRLSCRLNIKCNSNETIWKMYTEISNGTFLGEIVQSDILCSHFQINEKVLLENLEALKGIGFEIRNHKTNRQIKSGQILIPYPFPTLNERSLQRKTAL